MDRVSLKSLYSIVSLLFFCLLFSFPVFAEYYGDYYNNHSDPRTYPDVERRAHVEATCKECDDLADEYNSIVDKLFKADTLYREIEVSLYLDEKTADEDLQRIHSLVASPPKTDAEGQLQNAIKLHNNDVKMVTEHYNELTKLRTVTIAKLKYELFSVDKKFKACEAACSKKVSSVPLIQTNYFAMLPGIELQTGVLAGNTGGQRTGKADTAIGEDSNNKTSNHAMGGLQAKALFGVRDTVRPFVVINVEGINPSSDMLVMQHQVTKVDPTSSLKVTYDWLLRLIAGVESKPFFNNFSAGIGVGVAVLDQQIQASVKLPTSSGSGNKTNTYISPSVLANLTWLACQSCIAGHASSISLQVAADQFSAMNLRGRTSSGSTFQFGVTQDWLLSEMLVFSVHL